MKVDYLSLKCRTLQTRIQAWKGAFSFRSPA
jgi:hypothetical protein